MLKRLALFILSFIFAAMAIPQAVSAAPFNLEDFAYSATLSDAKSSLREMILPTSVYQEMHREDLGDLRVFNADGQPVPHQFSESAVLDLSQQYSLDFYPLNRQQAADTRNIRVIIKQKADEQTLNINQQINQQNSAISNEYQYIIENSKAKINNSSLCRLKLRWEQPRASMVLGLKLESSDDLHSWKSLSHDSSVSKLNYSGSELIRDELRFSCTTQKYLRLTWLKPEQGVQLKRVNGIYSKKGEEQTQWHSLGKPSYNKNGEWLFDSNVVAAFSQIELNAPQDGLLYKGMLYSRKTNNDTWRRRVAITQYKLTLGDSTFNSDALKIRAISDRHWKLVLSNEAKFTEAQLPEIRIGWEPKKLLFLAQGKAPFKIAFGNPSVTLAKSSDLQGLIQSLNDSGVDADRVTLGEMVQGNKSYSKAERVNWKKYLLWLVLILGTLLMTVMAYRLSQQMGEKQE